MICYILNICNLINPAEKRDLFLTYILPLVGPAIVVFTFYKNYKKDSKNKRKEARRAWYFKAYFEPSLKKLETFFDESTQIAEAGIKDFNQAFQGSTLEENILLTAEIQGCLAAKKRKFQIEVVQTIRIAYPKQAERSDELLNDFEDAGTSVFSNPEAEIPDENFYQYILEITNLKARLIHILSKPALLIKGRDKDALPPNPGNRGAFMV
jgi:hypothetical protein